MCFERSTAREALTYFWNCQTLGVSPAKPGAYRLSVKQMNSWWAVALGYVDPVTPTFKVMALTSHELPLRLAILLLEFRLLPANPS